MKLLFTIAFCASLLLLISCNSFDTKQLNPDLFVNNLFQGVYLADDVFFPQDTLVLNQFQFSDSTTKEKLLVHFRNDSIFLSNYNFDPWYGKWFCDFRKAKAVFDQDKLKIHAQFSHYGSWRCENNEEDHWNKIEYRLMDSTNHSLTLIKDRDTTNCVRSSVMKYLGRGRRNFTKEGGEEIRSDIQLR